MVHIVHLMEACLEFIVRLVTLAGGSLHLAVAVGARGAAAAVLHELVDAHEDAVPRAAVEVARAAHRPVVLA